MIAPPPFLINSEDRENIWPFEGAKKIFDTVQPTFAAYVFGKCMNTIKARGGCRFIQNYVARIYTFLGDIGQISKY